jgi:hypothetical protein
MKCLRLGGIGGHGDPGESGDLYMEDLEHLEDENDMTL